MPGYTHNTVPTQYVDADDIRFAYRRFGATGKTPVVFLQHFRGNMDNYDPAITDALAVDREVILFDTAGVGDTNGQARESVAKMARDAETFIDTAAGEWDQPTRDGYAYLKQITQPTLVVNGSDDVVIATVNSFILQQNLPDAQLILYPDSNHGAHVQYPEVFVAHVRLFLDDWPPH